MALEPLASTSDLDDRGIDTSDSTLAAVMLDVASAAIRSAAASPVSETTSTVVLYGWGDWLLPLPGQPVQSVASVSVDGVPVTDYKFVGDALWRQHAWGHHHKPASIEVNLTHGHAEVPADIVDLVCNLANAGMVEARSMADGGSFDPRVAVESIDDYRVQFKEGAETLGSVFDLPAGTRSMLRARFGGGAGVVEYR